jgi:hypothetical protein
MIHREPHTLSGKTVTANWRGETEEYDVEDYWDRVAGASWMDIAGNPAVIHYEVRHRTKPLPDGDDVLYGKDRYGLGHLVHISELAA